MRSLLVITMVLVLLIFPSNALADIAPPAQPPGANPQPGAEGTNVRMVAETVTIAIQKDSPDGSLGIAEVTAIFTMQNLGEQAESMAVRFPVSANDGWGRFPEIKNMRVKVDGNNVAVRKITGEDPYGYKENVPWIAFDVTFPPGKDVAIQAVYTLEADGEMPFIQFDYIFSTGAAWKGTIGSASLFVRFPYEVSVLNVLPDPYNPEKVIFPDHQLSGSELKWSFTDFEPELGDNFKIEIVAPSVWQGVLKERQNVIKNSSDGEAWGRLAKLYKELAFSSRRRGFRVFDLSSDPGARMLYTLSVEAYENAVRLKPLDALWHAGFADLLSYYSYFAAFEGVDTRADAVRAMREIQTAISLALDNPKVLEIAEEMTFYLDKGMVKTGDGYDYLWLTATPDLPTPTIDVRPETPTPETVILSTPSASPTTVTTPTAQPKRVLPICGSAFLIPLGFFLWVQRRK